MVNREQKPGHELVDIDLDKRFGKDWKMPEIVHAKPTIYNWTVYSPDNGKFKLGKYTDIGAYTAIFAHYGVEIEDNVQIGSHCVIYSISTIPDPRTGKGFAGKVHIGKNSCVGSHSTIMPGVHIGDNVIVGAHSFVNKDIPDGYLAFGSPVKLVKKIEDMKNEKSNSGINENDSASKEIFDLIKKENERVNESINLIPSENYASSEVLSALGSILNSKYSEGYPGKRYYGGNKYIDEIENIAIERAKKLFGAEHVNVQPYSGSPANIEVYSALIKNGDKILSLSLAQGGHLTHGHKVNFSGKNYTIVNYGVSKDTMQLDYDEIRQIALKEKPAIIVSGATAYPRTIDFKKFQEIAEEVGAIHLADISHISGLVATGNHPSPFPFTDVVTTTTHKTLRGPRGAMIMCKQKFADKIDKAVFPGMQGGPHNNTTAGIAIALKEAQSQKFKDYASQIVKNTKAFADELIAQGFKIVTNGSDNHLMLIDLTNTGFTGKQAEEILDSINITVNRNMIPYDPRSPLDPSGIRIGTPAMTTRGMKEEEMKKIARFMARALIKKENLDNLRNEVITLSKEFSYDKAIIEKNSSTITKSESSSTSYPIILDGKKLAEKVINDVGNEIKSKNIKLKLAIVLVGDNSVSESYIKSKAKKCESIGVDFEILRLEADEEKIVYTIYELNDDPSVNGIIVQLPIPKELDYDRIINSINPMKDVDSLTHYNIQEMELGNEKLVPCTPKGILKILESYNIDMKSKNVVLVGNGKLVGKPLSVMLKNRGVNPVVCNSKTVNLKEECLKADILISAAGIPHIITSEMVKPGAVVIDAGTSESSGKIVGDVDFENVSKKASRITPVPGGVGPMTVAMLIDNLLVARNLNNALLNEELKNLERDKK